MSSDYDRIESAVFAFIDAKAGARFKGSELLDYVQAKLKGSAKKGRKAAESGRPLAETALAVLDSMQDHIFRDEESGVFQAASAFFKGALFRATPSKFELEEGILMPFSRFPFFCDPELCGADSLTISPVDAPKVKSVSCVKRSMSFEMILDSHVLPGRNAVMDYLVAESDLNFKSIRSGSELSKSAMEMTVFDMRPYYDAVSFAQGGSLVFEVLDWSKGLFSFRHEKGPRPDDERLRWMGAFERALAATWREYNDYLEVSEQVSRALFFDACAGGELIRNPAVGLDEASRLFRDIALVQDGGDWMLVPSGELAEDDFEAPPEAVPGLAPDQFSVSKGNVSKTDELLKEMRFPYPLPVFQAMIFDEIANGCESFDEFYARNVATLGIAAVDDAQEAAFMNFVEDLWESSFESFTPGNDEPKAPLRTRLLDVSRSCAETLAGIIAKAKEDGSTLDIYKGQHRNIVAMQKDIMDTLSLLNSDNSLSEEGQDYENLELRVEDIEELWDSVLEELEPIVGS